MTRFRFIAKEAAQSPVSPLAAPSGFSRGGYYAWRARPSSARALADQELSERIGEIHDQKLAIYGAPRIHAELRLGHEIRVGKKRVARLMRELGWRAWWQREPTVSRTRSACSSVSTLRTRSSPLRCGGRPSRTPSIGSLA